MSGPQWPGEEVKPAQPAAPSSVGVRTIYTAPDPNAPIERTAKETSIRSAETGIADTAADNARADRSESRAVTKERIDNPQTLRREFYGLPEVKSYKVATQQLAQALNTGDGPQADLALTYAFAKAMDPDSVVREAEQGMVTNSQPWFQSAVENAKKQFGMDGAGNYTPEARAAIRQQIIRSVASRNRIYNQQRTTFSQLAQRYGVDPFEVVGNHDGDAFRDQFRAYDAERREDGANVAPVGGEQQPANPTAPPPTGGSGDQEGLVGGVSYDPAEWEDGKYVGARSDLYGRSEKDVKDEYLDAQLKKRGFDPNSFAAYVDRATQGGLFGNADEAYGVQGAIENLFGDEGVGTGYRMNRDLFRRALERSAEAQGWKGAATELLGGLFMGALLPGGSGVVGGAKAGATAGAAAGFGYGEGLEGSLTGAAGGAVIGGALGAGAGKLGDTLQTRAAARAPRPETEGARTLQATERLNQQTGASMQLLPADVGGPGIKNMSGGAGKMTVGGWLIGGKARKLTDEAQKARDAIAAMAGNPENLEAAGETALSGAQKFIQTSRTRVNALYTKARNLGGDEPVDLANARQALDEQIAELQATPGGAEGLSHLQALRADLNRPFPVEGVKRMRTQMRDGFIKDGLHGSDLERRVGIVLDAADDDITSGLSAAGKQDAAEAYAEAAVAHRERLDVIDNVLAPIIGRKSDAPKSGEEIMSAINSASQRNSARLGKFIRSLPEEDAQTVRATLISRLGQANKDQTEMGAAEFSLARFHTQYGAMNNRAKAELFGGELKAALDDLFTVAGARKASERYVNHSNTGAAGGHIATTGAMVGTLSVSPWLASLIAADAISAVALSSPKLVRVLAKAQKNPAAQKQQIDALTRIAANDNAIASEALGLRQVLMERLGQMPGRSAAEPTNDRREQSIPTKAEAGR